ncbi:TIDC1 factor, partial [Polypterus senegalus]
MTVSGDAQNIVVNDNALVYQAASCSSKDLLVETNAFSEEITNTIKSALMAAAVGMMYGGIPAARHARKRYIEQSNAEVYRHRIEAVRSAHNAAIRGFLRYGWRWSWRVAAFVTVFKSSRLNVTEDIITEIDNKLQNDSAKSDMEKIEDILSRKHDEHQIK